MRLEDRLDDFLHRDDLTPEEILAFRVALADHPELAIALSGWEAACGHIRTQVERGLLDRRVFVLCALDAAGHSRDLTEEEREEVRAARIDIEACLEKHPGLRNVVLNIDRDREDFLTIWEATGRPRIRWITNRVWRIAAAVAIMGVAGILAFVLMQRGQNWKTVTVAASMTEWLSLPDSSMVHLVGPAELSYDAGDFTRELKLKGRAFFDVVSRPEFFTVRTDEAVTRVLGTRFGIKDLDGSTEVVLESGSIEVAQQDLPEQRVILEPGQMSRVVGKSAPTTPEDSGVSHALEWTGTIFFRLTPMSQAVKVLTERFGRTVSVDILLADELITGSFYPDQSLEDIVNALAITLDAMAEESAEGWHVSSQ